MINYQQPFQKHYKNVGKEEKTYHYYADYNINSRKKNPTYEDWCREYIGQNWRILEQESIDDSAKQFESFYNENYDLLNQFNAFLLKDLQNNAKNHYTTRLRDKKE